MVCWLLELITALSGRVPAHPLNMCMCCQTCPFLLLQVKVHQADDTATCWLEAHHTGHAWAVSAFECCYAVPAVWPVQQVVCLQKHTCLQ